MVELNLGMHESDADVESAFLSSVFWKDNTVNNNAYIT